MSITPESAPFRPKTNCPFECYYDASKKSYLILDYDKNWIEQSEQQLIRRLKASGVGKTPDASGLRPIDRIIIAIQDYNSVIYTGPLAGHPRGPNHSGSGLLLVTSAARRINEYPGEWPIVGAFLRGLYQSDSCDQLPTYYSWIKVADEVFSTSIRRPGQALVIAGPRGCGKSLNQKFLTEIFGGRSGKPYEFMMGQTQFNRELFGAEHLMIEDEVASNDLRRRRTFGSFIKKMVANEVIGCYGKHREAISLQPLWRLSVTLNDEPENLLILPPMDESLADKMILFKAFHRPMPMPTGTLAEQSAFWLKLMEELPAFMHFIRREWEIPPDLRCERYGVRHYHHPDLVKAINDLSNEAKLLNLIDTAILTAETPVWVGTAEALEKQLHDHPASNHAIKSLLYFPNACGTYLGNLTKRHPNRVGFEGRSNNRRLWKLTIDPAQEESGVEQAATLPPVPLL